MTQKLLKAEKVAELLDVKIQRIWELTREKKIPFIQIGDRQYRYSETALINWLENGGTNQKPQTEQSGCLTLSK
jgi:excisionase family DNA binding protein